MGFFKWAKSLTEPHLSGHYPTQRERHQAYIDALNGRNTTEEEVREFDCREEDGAIYVDYKKLEEEVE